MSHLDFEILRGGAALANMELRTNCIMRLVPGSVCVAAKPDIWVSSWKSHN